MYQYMDILAMNMDEINRYVDDAMRDNPLIELLSPPEHFTHYSDWDAERQDAFELSENEKLKKDIKRLTESASKASQWADKVE